MQIISGKNRLIGRAVIAVALSLCFIAADKDDKADKPDKAKPAPSPTCTLADNFGVKEEPVSREKPLFAVCHNGKILCLPQPAAKAHIAHGDTPLGPCSKPGNNGPCP